MAARPGWELHVDRRGRSVNVSMAKGQGRLDDRESSGVESRVIPCCHPRTGTSGAVDGSPSSAGSHLSTVVQRAGPIGPRRLKIKRARSHPAAVGQCLCRVGLKACRESSSVWPRRPSSPVDRSEASPFRGSCLRNFPSRSRRHRQGLNGCMRSSSTATHRSACRLDPLARKGSP